jgi:hypothetical protein
LHLHERKGKRPRKPAGRARTHPTDAQRIERAKGKEINVGEITRPTWVKSPKGFGTPHD